MLSYKSDYPNQVQQLNVSISKNLFLLKDGTIKYQDKKFDINWKNYQKSKKKHLVTFIVRDHFSSCFYAELHPIDELPKIEEFLFNAWSEKENYEFYGIGKTCIIPNSTLQLYPGIQNFFKNVDNVHLQLPENGFSSAIRSIREWEQKIIHFISWYSNLKKINDFKENIEIINREINDSYNRENSNLKKWMSNEPKITNTPSKVVFFKFFEK